MKSPDLLNIPRLTREEIEASFKPCPICFQVEKSMGGGIYRISHDMDLHFPNDRLRTSPSDPVHPGNPHTQVRGA